MSRNRDKAKDYFKVKFSNLDNKEIYNKKNYLEHPDKAQTLFIYIINYYVISYTSKLHSIAVNTIISPVKLSKL